MEHSKVYGHVWSRVKAQQRLRELQRERNSVDVFGTIQFNDKKNRVRKDTKRAVRVGGRKHHGPEICCKEDDKSIAIFVSDNLSPPTLFAERSPLGGES